MESVSYLWLYFAFFLGNFRIRTDSLFSRRDLYPALAVLCAVHFLCLSDSLYMQTFYLSAMNTGYVCAFPSSDLPWGSEPFSRKVSVVNCVYYTQ